MSWFSDLFGGGKNPADAAMPYLNQIPGQTNQYMQPWFDAGKNMIPGLSDQYKQLMTDPSKRLNDIGSGYKESPGFKFAMQQALQGAGHASAAGGMAGSPQHEQQNMELAQNIASKDYNDYMNNALGLYGMGLNGGQTMSGQGQQAGQSMADMIAQTLAQQANMAFRGEQEKNSMNNSWLSGLGRLGGAALGGLAGGPWGAFAGWNMGK
jgi:hypothetical protein